MGAPYTNRKEKEDFSIILSFLKFQRHPISEWSTKIFKIYESSNQFSIIKLIYKSHKHTKEV